MLTIALLLAAIAQSPLPTGGPSSAAATAEAQRPAASTGQMSPAAAADLEAVVALLVGSFSSEQQSKDDAEYRDIRLHMARIWTDQATHGAWLYVEQAAASAMDRPYRQRVYWVTPQTYLDAAGKERIEIRSEVYMLPGDAKAFANAWKDPETLRTTFASITPAELAIKDGCAVMLKKSGAASYSGGTVGSGCPSELAGAAYATSLVEAEPSGLRTWDRGYKASGEQVWGAVKGHYHFVRQKD